RPVPDHRGGPGDLARDRPGPAGPAVQAGADPAAPDTVTVLLRWAGRAAHRGRITHRLLVGRVFFRAHAAAPAAHVRGTHAGGGRRALAAAARRAARPAGPERDRRGAAGRLVAAAARRGELPAPAVGVGDAVQRGHGGLASASAVRRGRAGRVRAHLADARQLLPGWGAVLAPVHPAPAVPPPDATRLPGRRAGADQ